jgi:hypothetical protein
MMVTAITYHLIWYVCFPLKDSTKEPRPMVTSTRPSLAHWGLALF